MSDKSSCLGYDPSLTTGRCKCDVCKTLPFSLRAIRPFVSAPSAQPTTSPAPSKPTPSSVPSSRHPPPKRTVKSTPPPKRKGVSGEGEQRPDPTSVPSTASPDTTVTPVTPEPVPSVVKEGEDSSDPLGSVGNVGQKPMVTISAPITVPVVTTMTVSKQFRVYTDKGYIWAKGENQKHAETIATQDGHKVLPLPSKRSVLGSLGDEPLGEDITLHNCI